MSVNPVLKQLGLPDDARVLVLHADDIGMCHASLLAYEKVLPFRVLSSAATMVPCPWYPATAAYCRAHADDPHLDMGVHLTLTSEWKHYRWKPLTTLDPASGLIDEEGYFHRLAAPVEANADLGTLEIELRAQIERALNDGIDVTHIDTHMLTLFGERLLPVYVKLGLEYRLPVFLLRDAGHLLGWAGKQNGVANELEQVVATALGYGMPCFDYLDVLPLDHHENRLEDAKSVLDAVPVGLTNLLHHMSADTLELRALAPDWRCRVADMELFSSEEWRVAVAESGVTVIGFKVLRDLFRQNLDVLAAVGSTA